MDFLKKYQIFISSTYTDLKKARAKVTEKILSMYHFPIGMEMFSAGNDDQWSVIKRTIDISDYYVLIIGHRYGSTTESGISYTEKEYDYAREKGIPVLAFIKNRNAPTTPSERENELEKQVKLETFIKKAMSSKMCDFWESEEELASKVSIALMKEFMHNPSLGWVRADNPNIGLKKKENDESLIKKNLEQYIIEYLDEKRRHGLSDGTISGYKLELNIFKQHFYEKKAMDINTQDIKNYLRTREDSYGGYSKSTLERIRLVLNGFFEWLVEESYVEKNPIRKVRAYKYSDAIVEALNMEEIEELRKACNTLRDRALIEILLSTGCQLGELEKLSKKNIDWEKHTLNVIGINHRHRVVILNEEAEKHLKKYLESREDNTEYLFVTERRPFRVLSRRGVQRVVDEISQKTKIDKKISPKVFRHTFAKIMLEKGYPMNIVQSFLGNKEYTSTAETYVKITNENINRIMNMKQR